MKPRPKAILPFSPEVYELWPQVLTFLLVVEYGSMTKAGDMLNISATAVSKQIRLLEQRLGLTLLERTTRRVTATDLGQQFAQRCQQTATHLQDHFDFLTHQEQEPTGTLRILSTHAYSQIILSANISHFCRQYPKIHLDIQLSEVIPEAKYQYFDILVGFPQLPSIAPWFHIKNLLTVQYALYASPDYLQQYGQPTNRAQLIQHRFLNHSMRHPVNSIPFADDPLFLMPDPNIIVDHGGLLVEWCMEGLGIAYLSNIMAKPALLQNKIVEILPDHPLLTATCCMFYRQSTYPDAKIEAFKRFNHVLTQSYLNK